MHFFTRLMVVLALVGALSACGGGGGGGSSHTSAVSTTTPGSTTTTTTTTTSNSTGPTVSLAAQSGVNLAPISVNAGLNAEVANVIFVTVTICAQGTTNCATIPDVQVDTGSSGLRLVSSVVSGLNAGLVNALPRVSDAGAPLAECAQFADGVTWGSVRLASVTVGGATTTAATPINLLGDPAVGDVPSTCKDSGAGGAAVTVENSTSLLGANGIIGIGYFAQDCGTDCVNQAFNGFYYSCSGSVCTSQSSATLAEQVTNPVTMFATGYNNGNVLELPSIAESGAGIANGYLVFGVNTFAADGVHANNMLGSATLLGLNDDTGELTVSFNNQSLTESFIDSGSSVYFFSDPALAECTAASGASGYFCPASPFAGSAILVGQTPNLPAAGVSLANNYALNFTVDNAAILFSATPTEYAFDDLAAPATSSEFPGSGTFDVGASFFYGRSVYTIFQVTTSAGNEITAPYAAVGTAQ